MTGRERAHFILLARHMLLRGLPISPHSQMRERSADRRSGACRHPSRADDAGPQARARRLASFAIGTLASRRSTAGFVASVPRKHPTSCDAKGHASSSRPLLVAEGGCPEPPGSCVQGNARDAASRSAHTMPRDEHPQANGTRRNIVLERELKSEIAPVYPLSCGCPQRSVVNDHDLAVKNLTHARHSRRLHHGHKPKSQTGFDVMTALSITTYVLTLSTILTGTAALATVALAAV